MLLGGIEHVLARVNTPLDNRLRLDRLLRLWLIGILVLLFLVNLII